MCSPRQKIVHQPYERDARREHGQTDRLYCTNNWTALLESYLRKPGPAALNWPAQPRGKPGDRFLYDFSEPEPRWTLREYLVGVLKNLENGFGSVSAVDYAEKIIEMAAATCEKAASIDHTRFELFKVLTVVDLADGGSGTQRYVAGSYARGNRIDTVEINFGALELNQHAADVLCFMRLAPNHSMYAVVRYYEVVRTDYDLSCLVVKRMDAKTPGVKAFGVVHAEAVEAHAHLVPDFDQNDREHRYNHLHYFWDKVQEGRVLVPGRR